MAFQTPLAFGFQKEVNCVIVCKNDFSYATFFIKGCCKRAKVSATAKSDGCTYATNAGFFDTKNGCCVGNLITHSAVQTVSESGMVLLFIVSHSCLQLASTNRSNFGLTKDGYVLGYLKNTTIEEMKFIQLISGAGWLVRQ